MITTLIPEKLKEYVMDYDYEITIDQSKDILELLNETSYNGTFTSTDIQMATDYIVNGSESMFKNYFE